MSYSTKANELVERKSFKMPFRTQPTGIMKATSVSKIDLPAS
jgi:hypothetical protein